MVLSSLSPAIYGRVGRSLNHNQARFTGLQSPALAIGFTRQQASSKYRKILVTDQPFLSCFVNDVKLQDAVQNTTMLLSLPVSPHCSPCPCSALEKKVTLQEQVLRRPLHLVTGLVKHVHHSKRARFVEVFLNVIRSALQILWVLSRVYQGCERCP